MQPRLMWEKQMQGTSSGALWGQPLTPVDPAPPMPPGHNPRRATLPLPIPFVFIKHLFCSFFTVLLSTYYVPQAVY